MPNRIHRTEAEAVDPRRVYAIEAPVPEVLDVTFDGGTHDLTWDEYVDAFAEYDARRGS